MQGLRNSYGSGANVKHMQNSKSRTTFRIVCFAVSLIVSFLILICFFLTIRKIKMELHTDYMTAQAAITDGDYQSAIDIFDMLGPNYQEARKYKEYAMARMLYDDQRFEDAWVIFESLGNFEDSSMYLTMIEEESADNSNEDSYAEACKCYVEENYARAFDIFNKLGEYNNSRDLAERSKALWRQQCANVISAGIRCSVGITENGGAKLSCGDFFFGRDDIEQNWSDVVSVSACGEFVLGLKEDGTVYLATMERDDRYDYQISTSDWTDIIAVSAGEQFIVGLRSDGTIVSSGSFEEGNVELRSWEKIVAIDTGWQHVVGLDQDGNVHIAGKHVEQLQNDIDAVKDQWSDLIAISTGGSIGFENGVRNRGLGHIVALRRDGKVLAVGDDEYGQRDVTGWENVVAISAGDYHTVALTKEGRILSTQRKDDFPDSYEEINNQWASKKFRALSAGYGSTLGVEVDGSVCNAGLDKNGQSDVAGWKIKQ